MKPIVISKKKLIESTTKALFIIATLLLGYFFGHIHNLYITREPIEFIGEINPNGCK